MSKKDIALWICVLLSGLFFMIAMSFVTIDYDFWLSLIFGIISWIFAAGAILSIWIIDN